WAVPGNPGTLPLANASAFAAGGENMFVQTAAGVVVISFTGISGNTLQGCVYGGTFNGTAGNIPSGSFVSCWAFNSGVTTDFRIPYVQAFRDAITATAGTPVLAAFGDVEGIFTSLDLGQHWSVNNTGMYAQHWRRCATGQWSVTEANALYACVGLNGNSGGFLVSTNGGQSWAMRSTQVQFSGNTSNYPAPAPNDQARPTGNVLAQCGVVSGSPLMYAATYSGGVSRSRNNGNSWQSIGLSGG